MFGSKINIDMVKAMTPTSKETLKYQCLLCSGGDIWKARELYDFYASDMTELPDFDPPVPSRMETLKENAGSIFGWIKDNKDDLMGLYEFVKSVRGGGVPKSNPLPPIN